jgi:hypothetical protein
VALVAGGCSDSGSSAAPDTTTAPETTLRITTTTVRATTTSTTLRPTTTVTTLLQMGPGEAHIGGTVFGPGGPVDGATVRIERLVGKLVAPADITTTGGGSWQMPSILGGSYRVRAFKPPDLGTSAVESFFLAANERKTIDLRLPAVGGERITAVVNPSPPRLEQPATLTIQVGTGRVDGEGRAVISPRPGVPLTLSPGPGIAIESVPQVVTDGSGSAAWRIRCGVEGANTVTLAVANGVTQVTFAGCAAPPAAPATPTTRR